MENYTVKELVAYCLMELGSDEDYYFALGLLAQ